MTRRVCTASLLVGAVGLAACADDGTTRTLEVDGAGGVVRSHDGLFTLEIPPGALSSAVELSITTRSDVLASELDSLVYEVAPAGVTFAQPARATYRAPRLAWVGRRTLATFDGGRAEELPAIGARYDHLEHLARGEVRALGPRQFGLARRIEAGACNACGQLCGGCDASQPGCMPDPDGPRCDGASQCTTEASSCPAHGWDAAPGASVAYVIHSLAIAGAGVGHDLDGRCAQPGRCADNALAGLGPIANDQLRQGLLGGESLVLVELAGLDHPGDLVGDGSLTVKLYEGRDADVPYFPANNFSIPTGDTTCCEFVISSGSLAGAPPQARGRIPARLGAGVVASSAAGTGALLEYPLVFVNTSTDPLAAESRQIEFYDARISFRVDALGLHDGLLGGVLVPRELGGLVNPYCRERANLCVHDRVDGTVLELMIDLVGQPDIDRDGDGLERFELGSSQRVERCLDGDGTPVPPVDAAAPWTCVADPRVADGYSVAYTFAAVPANIRGLGR